jgi:hypothetical protein
MHKQLSEHMEDERGVLSIFGLYQYVTINKQTIWIELTRVFNGFYFSDKTSGRIQTLNFSITLPRLKFERRPNQMLANRIFKY